MTSTVSTVVCNPLKSFRSTVASTVPQRFVTHLQPIDVAASTVLDGPLSRNPHTPRALPGGIPICRLPGTTATSTATKRAIRTRCV